MDRLRHSSRKRERRGDTSIKKEKYDLVSIGLTSIPNDFNIHKKLVKVLEKENNLILGKIGIDWSSAEALALGSLLVEGVKIRLTGQDSGRGTFSQETRSIS